MKRIRVLALICAYSGNNQEIKAIMKAEDFSETEFYEKYGTPVYRDNIFTAEDFIALLEDLKTTV